MWECILYTYGNCDGISECFLLICILIFLLYFILISSLFSLKSKYYFHVNVYTPMDVAAALDLMMFK